MMMDQENDDDDVTGNWWWLGWFWKLTVIRMDEKSDGGDDDDGDALRKLMMMLQIQPGPAGGPQQWWRPVACTRQVPHEGKGESCGLLPSCVTLLLFCPHEIEISHCMMQVWHCFFSHETEIYLFLWKQVENCHVVMHAWKLLLLP